MLRRTIEDIELDKVLEAIASSSLSSEGRRKVLEDNFTSDESVLSGRYEKIDRFMNLIVSSPPLDPFPDISRIMEKMASSHLDLDGIEIRSIAEYLRSYFGILSFQELSDSIAEDDRALSDEILRYVDSMGNVEEFHPRILPFVKEHERAKSERMRASMQFIGENRASVQNQSPMYRNERVVIPIRNDQKMESECYISGSSQSGQTLFAEPFFLVELNNQVILAEERIRSEKARILHDFSARIVRMEIALKAIRREVEDFDFHYSFALWLRKTKARHPQKGDTLSLLEARHPLIRENCVPVTVSLDKGVKGLVLSGANAGGKTVTMKTIALLAALNQICSFVPASELSVLPIFSSIYTDIGDNQSISDNASTFSSHMKNISSIAKAIDGKSLVILDELGSGTDPEEGSALSIAILEYMRKHSGLTVITSHYSAVKNHAYATEGLMNASMEFNEKSSLPTYRVLAGIPGESHALSTARRMAMPKEITDMAFSMLSDDSQKSANIITSLLSKSRTLDRRITEATLEKRRAEEKGKRLEEELTRLRAKELELEKDGCREISSYLSSSRKKLERLVMDVATGKLDRNTTVGVKAFLDDIDRKKKEIEERVEKEEEISFEPDREYEKGMSVLCGKNLSKGTVLEKTGKGRYLVQMENGLRLQVRTDMMKPGTESKEKPSVSHFQSQTRKASYSIDVRGCTLEEALRRVDDQIESALLSSLSSFQIIHGLGDGILSKGIHLHLKKQRSVKDYMFARPEDGGMGKTYVELDV